MGDKIKLRGFKGYMGDLKATSDGNFFFLLHPRICIGCLLYIVELAFHSLTQCFIRIWVILHKMEETYWRYVGVCSM